MKPRVFSAMQPSGNLHIGNYLGALKSWVAIQYDYEPIFGIVDLHAITVYQDPAELRKKIEEVAAIYIASGLDPRHCAIVAQSAVPAHVELAWVLTCITSIGWLERMTQYKAKLAAFSGSLPVESDPFMRLFHEGLERFVGAGLLMYPVLMAADILLYQAAIVPVGEDQAQHLELTRDIAQRFNSLYGETFVLPQTHLPAVGARVMGLDDPSIKMSKSAPGTLHRIEMLDPPERVKKVIGRATTDSKPGVEFDDLSPGVGNLLGIFQAFSGWTDDQIRKHFAGMNYGGLKKQVTDMVVASLDPIQQRYREITGEPGYLRRVLEEGAQRVSPIANSTVELVKKKTGLYT